MQDLSMFGYVGASTFPTILIKQAVWLTANYVFKLHGAHTICVANAG
jgi:hypothetical protein